MFSARPTGGRSRHRGVTLIATVLITALAATIALVAVQQAVMTTRSEAVRTDYGRAYTETQTVQSEFERRLRDNPTFYLESMFEWERPRVCHTPPPTEVAAVVFHSQATKRVSTAFPYALPPTDPRNPTAGIATGTAGTWPAACGTYWGYPAVGENIPGFTYQNVRAEIIPPTPANPVITLKVLARYGKSEAGLTATYQVPSVAGYTVYSGSDLLLSNVYTSNRPTVRSTVQGNVYSAGSLWGPTDKGAKIGDATLFSEKGIVGNIDSRAKLYSGSAGQVSTSPDIKDIRTKVPNPRTFPSLVSSAGGLPAVGCRTAIPSAVVNYPASSPLAGYSSQLCLKAGGAAVTSAGAAVTFPAAAKAWLVLPDGDFVRVYSSTSLPTIPGACATHCDLIQLAKSGKHPGEALATSTTWTAHGSFNLPASGVIAADNDVFFSRCDGALTQTSCGTATFPGGNVPGGGVTANKSLTVIAGTPAKPADVWLQGPVRTSKAAARVGLVATGQMKVPYWSHGLGSKLDVEANLAALGLGTDKDAFTSFPAKMSKTTPGSARAWGSDLVVTGSVAAEKFNAPLSGFDTVTIKARAAGAASPSFPGFTAITERVSNQRQDSTAFCDLAFCYQKW
jgi:hypothetical protein